MKNYSLRQIHSRSGFNLIEVSLAIAICSIGLIALIGLIPTGTEASRRAADDTLAAGLASDVLHWRHISPATNLTSLFGVTALDVLPRATNPDVTAVLDAMGNFDVDEFGNTNVFYGGPYFLLTYRLIDHPQFPGNPDIARAVVKIQWPCFNSNGVVALSANASTRTFVSNFARLQ